MRMITCNQCSRHLLVLLLVVSLIVGILDAIVVVAQEECPQNDSQLWESFLTTRAERGRDGALNLTNAPGPWTNQISESYIFTFDFANLDDQGREHIRMHLPTITDQSDFLETGLSMIMIIRYSETPVGAHDELAFLAGNFRERGSGPSSSTTLFGVKRVPRIYVDSEASLRNGRRNFGIRKELADFEWTDLPGERGTRVTIHERYSGRAMLLNVTLSRGRLAFPFAGGHLLPMAALPTVERVIDEEGIPLGGDNANGVDGGSWGRLPGQFSRGNVGFCWLDEIHSSPGIGFPDISLLNIQRGFFFSGSVHVPVPDILD